MLLLYYSIVHLWGTVYDTGTLQIRLCNYRLRKYVLYQFLYRNKSEIDYWRDENLNIVITVGKTW